MQHIPKQSHCVRWPAHELLCSSLCDPLTETFGDPAQNYCYRAAQNRTISVPCQQLHFKHVSWAVWGAVRKNIISDRFSTKTAISAYI